MFNLSTQLCLNQNFFYFYIYFRIYANGIFQIPIYIIAQKFIYIFYRLYESAPWSVEAWGRPVESSPLASTRLAGAGNSNSTNTVNPNTVSFCGYISIL